MTHNGWTNRETWLMAAWLANDEAAYSDTQAMADEARTRSADEDRVLAELTDKIRGYAMMYLFDGGDLIADLVDAALCHVNWREIAEGVLKD